MRMLLLGSIVGLVFFPLKSKAFPEMVRYGYAKCISCHVSPSGGGLLNSYGKQSSQEILSTWGTETEAKPFEGLFSTPDFINAGGDFRALVFRDNIPQSPPGQKQSDYIPMEADLEAAGTYKDLTVDATLGLQESQINTPPGKGALISRRHYLLYHVSDNVGIRAGRFIPAYGINIPEHAVVVRDDLGFGEGLETYNIETQISGETWDVFATAIFGRPDNAQVDREKGGALSGGFLVADRFKLGASFYYGANNTQVRDVYGPWAILGFTKHFFLLTEIDTQLTTLLAPGTLQTGMANYQRLDYEFFQGVHVFISNEYLQPDLTTSSTISRVYSLGTQLLPRPHFDIQLTWQKTQSLAGGDPNFYDFAFLMGHYYL